MSLELIESKGPVTRKQVERFQTELLKLPQIELETRHYFANGMYCREVICPAGTMITGKVQKHEHFFMVTRGKIQVTTDSGVRILEAGTVLVSSPGTKRAAYHLEDSVILTVHRTELTDLEEVEEFLYETDLTSPFLVGNKLNKPKIEGE